MRVYDVTRATALADLHGLVEAGFLDRGRQGKELVFTPVRDLATRLELGRPE
jgi:hypothetical protein